MKHYIKKQINNILNNRIAQILVFGLFDILSIALTAYLALALRFDFGEIETALLESTFRHMPFDALIMLLVFSLLGMYNSVWQYASVRELINIILANTVVEAFVFGYKAFFGIEMCRSYFIIHLILMLIATCASRYAYRIASTVITSAKSHKLSKRTMIIGAGNAARLLMDEISRDSRNFESKVACIIDDNKSKVGSKIHNVPIVGTRKDIEEAVYRYEIDEIIIAIPSASKETIKKITAECQKTDCEIKILPSVYLSLNGGDQNLMKNVRPISYEDFLGRDQIVVDSEEIADSIEGKSILVTGGGGSIGSELCRQIAKCKPSRLVIFDIYENNAYEIQQELGRKYPELNLHAVIGSVRDYDRLEKVFKEFQPDQVYHAAAHKHVPLMEVSPNEAIKNNCLGTLNCAKLANKYKVKKFVLISTDKAVRPTNVMGASKRICEMIIQSYDKLSQDTDFVAVRFGNVLGSNGSVIPLFLKQIEAGGPVTVTHKEITRYFMTIPEAVSLVLQAGVYAKGGRIFVLDMGKPVRIYDLAKQIIRYKGLKPGEDIEIKITGLRPGEKLYEEMLMDEEGLKKTPNDLIFIGKPLKIKKSFLDDLDELIKASYKNGDDIKEKVASVVGNYHVDKKAKIE